MHKRFAATIRYQNGVVMEINDEGRNGILFEGDKGRMFVNRGSISGVPVEATCQDIRFPVSHSGFTTSIISIAPSGLASWMRSSITWVTFLTASSRGKQPISDLESQHRSVTTCHLANISIRTGRPLKWDPDAERILGDDEAAAMQSRPQREGFEVA